MLLLFPNNASESIGFIGFDQKELDYKYMDAI